MTSESENVLKALSSSTRRTIMKQISEKGSATYTEIMHVLNLDPSLMSGTFNYHLKELYEAGLIARTNGEYRITDLGKRGLILVDQVAKDVKVDQYGVLSAVMSMSPRKELELFASQMGMMVGTVLTIVSLIPFALSYSFGTLVYQIAVITLIASAILGIGSTAKMIGILRKLKVGFSVVLFLGSNWFFIRSPNRNRFFFITMFAVGAVVIGALAGILPFSGVIPLFSQIWYTLTLSAIGSAVLTIAFFIDAKRNADRLEEINGEQ
jgi:DNA-binding transcriptional ArsR family regulator